jgi:predicted nucleic-acid-binding protein
LIGLDTNILARYLVQDDAVQSPRASTLIDSLTDERRAYISLTVLLELVWVLRSNYGVEKAGMIRILEMLLRTRAFVVEQAATVSKAIDLFYTSRADFEDCLISCSCAAAGCDETVTFDSLAAKTAGMRLLK